jgi:hypothetical protein
MGGVMRWACLPGMEKLLEKWMNLRGNRLGRPQTGVGAGADGFAANAADERRW